MARKGDGWVGHGLWTRRDPYPRPATVKPDAQVPASRARATRSVPNAVRDRQVQQAGRSHHRRVVPPCSALRVTTTSTIVVMAHANQNHPSIPP